MPTRALPIDSAGIDREIGKAQAPVARSAPQARLAVEPIQDYPLEQPQLAPAAERIDPLPLGKVAISNPASPLAHVAEAGGHPATWIAGAGLIGAVVLWRRRRGRQGSGRSEARKSIHEDGPGLIHPHWEYDPGPFDSDDFLRRWDSVGLSISGEWVLLLAIAGRIGPDVARFTSRRQAASRSHAWMTFRPDWRYRPFAGDAPEHLGRWCRLGLSLHGDPLLASMAGGQLEWMFDLGTKAETPAEQVVLQPPPVLEDSVLPVEEQATWPGDAGVVSEQAPASLEIAVTPPQEDPGGTAWLSRIAPLLRGWESSGAPEIEQQLWEVSRHLCALAEALPSAARTPWLDAVEALAERMAHGACETSRGAWRAHWVDLRLARLGAMNGAWRLLELRALHDACVHDDAPEVLAAKVRLLNVWAGALLGPAAKAKRAEAAALAASLRDDLAATA